MSAAAVTAHLSALGCTVRKVGIPSGVAEKWDAADAIAEGVDVRPLLRDAESCESKVRPRIRLLTLQEMQSLPPLSWLIQDVITERGLSMIWGRSGSLKSFVALDMAMSVASGRLWHGKPVKKGRVIYIAAEGAFGLAQRAIGWQQHRAGDEQPDILLVPHGVILTSDDLDALIEAINAAGTPPALIIIDTVSRTFAGNPNQPADMNAYVAAEDRLREGTGAHVMSVHHAGEDEDRNEVGNKGLRNACDTVIFVKRNRDQVQLVNEAPKGKQKDAEEFKTITLRPVKVAYQQGSDERTTLLLNLEDQPNPAPDGASDASEQRLGAVEKRIVTALRKANTSFGVTRLSTMLNGTAKGTLYNSLASLVTKEIIEKIRSENDNHDEWRLL